jgi:hypothetical protein
VPLLPAGPGRSKCAATNNRREFDRVPALQVVNWSP